MSTRFIKPIAGRDYSLLPNGSIVVAKECPDFRTPYRKEKIPDYLGLADHKLRYGKKEYQRRFLEEGTAFRKSIYNKLVGSRRFLIVEMNGYDGSGKSGAIKRLNWVLGDNAKIFMPVPFGKPSQEELDHGWLWKYGIYQFMPMFGQVRAFDRGPVERLLVERVKRLAPANELDAAYNQLSAWTWLQVQQGGIYIRFWMDISKKEQATRFEDREREHKEKITPDDYEAAKLRPKYRACANEAIHRIGHSYAPFFVISSEDKYYSRVTVLQNINHVLAAELR